MHAVAAAALRGQPVAVAGALHVARQAAAALLEEDAQLVLRGGPGGVGGAAVPSRGEVVVAIQAPAVLVKRPTRCMASASSCAAACTAAL